MPMLIKTIYVISDVSEGGVLKAHSREYMAESNTKGPETKMLREPLIVTNPLNHGVAMLEQLVAKGPLGEFYVGRIINLVQLLAQRIIDGEAPPNALGLDLPYKELAECEEPVIIQDPVLVKRIYEQAEHEWDNLQKLKPEQRKETLEALMKGYIDPELQNNELVGVKVIRPQVDDEELRERLNRENYLLRKFSYPNKAHPNVVRRIGKTDDPALGTCIFLEYIEGETLRDCLNRQPGKKFIPQKAVSLAIKIAEALQYVHGKGVIHRDLKPANILLRKSNGDPAIIDFGTSKDEDVDVTQVGARMGTPTYMAPEQLQDAKKATKQSDVYSLSQMLAQMLTGEHPLPFKEEKDAIAAIQKQYHHWAVRKFFPDIHSELEVLVEVGRAKNLKDRYHCDEFCRQAHRIQEQEWYFEPKEDLPTPSTELKRQRKELKVKIAGLNIKLQTRELEEQLITVRQHTGTREYVLAQSTLDALETQLKDYQGNKRPFEQEISGLKEEITSGLLDNARKHAESQAYDLAQDALQALEVRLKDYQGNKDAFEKEINTLKGKITDGMTCKAACKHLDAAKSITAQTQPDYVALGDELEHAKQYLDRIAQDGHADVREQYASLWEQYDPHKDFVSLFKNAQKTLTNITKDIAQLEKCDADAKPVNTEILKKIPARLDLADSGLQAVPGGISPQHETTKTALTNLMKQYHTLAEKYLK